MRIEIDNRPYEVPASTAEFTLGDRIAFDTAHGPVLRETLERAQAVEEGYERLMAMLEYHCELACRTLSHFAGIPLGVVQQTKTDEVLAIYQTVMESYSEEVDFAGEGFRLEQSFEWRGELWEVAPPELKHESVMTFGEFLDAKQWMKNLYELGQGKWEALLMLCCVYLRKKGEAYREELTRLDGERYRLMQHVPFSMALHVGFFLSASMDSFLQTFPSFAGREAAAGPS